MNLQFLLSYTTEKHLFSMVFQLCLTLIFTVFWLRGVSFPQEYLPSRRNYLTLYSLGSLRDGRKACDVMRTWVVSPLGA